MNTAMQRTSLAWVLCALVMIVAFSSPPARAALDIEIIGSGANQIPIAIAPFRAEEGLPTRLTSVITADLVRSGLFKSVDPGGVVPIPHEPEQINYPQWKARGAEALVIGNVVQRDGQYEISFRLMDVLKGTQLTGFLYRASPAQLRLTAHKIADAIYEKMTGDPGVFSTKITYVMKRSNTSYLLQVADADGFDPQTVLSSTEPIISPSWSPDGTRLAYVSFENRKPIVYVQTLATKQRRAVANFTGSNSAPAWSPDGRRLAVTLTKDGGSQIYSIPADGGSATRLTNSSGIDTEPNFSPDGQWIIFTSDRGGGPQIYRMPSSGGQAQRLTFEGSYNVSPRHSPDGKSFTFIQRQGGRFNVAVQDFATRQMQQLTDGTIDESPSFAPNGRMILYASDVRGRGILAAVSSDGRVKQRFTEQGGDVREPAWGPLVK